MKVIIIPRNQRTNYDKRFDTFNGLNLVELKTGEYFINLEVLNMLEQYANDETKTPSVRESARLTKIEFETMEQREILESDIVGYGLGIDDPPEVTYPYEGRNIRVFISDRVLRAITKSQYKPLIDLALAVPAQEESENGVTLWLERFGNEYFSDEQVEGVLRSFGAQINIKQ